MIGIDLANQQVLVEGVVGDIAMITGAKTNQPLPQPGSVAQQAGRHASENRRIAAKL